MKKITKVFGALTIVGMLFSTTNAYATTNSVWSDGHSFEDDWEDSQDTSDWTLVYGFNTSWIDEDYTHTKHYSSSHTAAISNEDGGYKDSAKAGKWAEIEVSHAGSTVMYGIIY